jgi:hypothetical protein
MSHDWIDRFTCDRCGQCVEQPHSVETWPHGWKEIHITGDRQRLMCPECARALRAALGEPT